MTENRMRRDAGSVLVMAIVLSFVMILIGVAFLTSAVTLHEMISEEISIAQAVFGAPSAAMFGVARNMAGDPSRNGSRLLYDDVMLDYRVIVRGQQDHEWGFSNNLRIVGTGTSDYQGMHTTRDWQVEYVYETYADYLYLSHKERDSLRHVTIRFWTPDTLDGKVHSNDTISIVTSSDRPRFMEKVTTSARVINPPGNHARFDKGWGYRVPIIFPDQADEIRNNTGWRDWGHGDPDSVTELTLSGPYIYKRDCGPFTLPNNVVVIRCDPPYIGGAPYRHIPPSGALFVPGKVWIKAARGTGDLTDGPYPNPDSILPQRFVSEGFEGQLTIASSDTMLLMDNIVYKHSKLNNAVPTTMDSCSDILGLISENFIMIGKDVRDVVYINAALAAVVGSISVQDIYWQQPPGWDNEKQSLFIWGSLAQRNRGIVHTTDYPPGHLRGFIEKDYHYDVRFKITPPPHFVPTLDRKLIFVDDFSIYGGD